MAWPGQSILCGRVTGLKLKHRNGSAPIPSHAVTTPSPDHRAGSDELRRDLWEFRHQYARARGAAVTRPSPSEGRTKGIN